MISNETSTTKGEKSLEDYEREYGELIRSKKNMAESVKIQQDQVDMRL